MPRILAASVRFPWVATRPANVFPLDICQRLKGCERLLSLRLPPQVLAWVQTQFVQPASQGVARNAQPARVVWSSIPRLPMPKSTGCGPTGGGLRRPGHLPRTTGSRGRRHPAGVFSAEWCLLSPSLRIAQTPVERSFTNAENLRRFPAVSPSGRQDTSMCSRSFPPTAMRRFSQLLLVLQPAP